MKKIMSIAVALGFVATASLADPILGIWKTQPDGGGYAHVKIAPCGDAYCGTIIRTFTDEGEHESEHIGKQLMRNMTPKGDGQYRGKVWRPSNDKIYLGKVTVNGTAMQLKGCVLGGLFCAKQAWTKIK